MGHAVKKILELLKKKYPEPEIELRYSNPLELLVATILSAQCTDKRVNEVTKSLFRKYCSAGDYARADASIFEEEIRPTGFFRNKAKSIINCCKKIVQDFNGEIPSTMEELTTLAGVGRKTANVVLGGAFGKEAIAVDTHVIRTSNRLGLVNNINPDKIEELLMKQLPRHCWTFFSLAIILHGRQTCAARKPKCGECVLYDECEWPEKGKGIKGLGIKD
ncbi:MAG: endonuclease III [Proteobacteria bacterium]|nr:endonuclease III [Pseudomonadota bacterium]